MNTPPGVAYLGSHLNGAAVFAGLGQLERADALRVVLVATDDPLGDLCNAGGRLWRYGFDDELRLLVSRLAARAGLRAHTGSVKDDAFFRLFTAAAPDAIVTMVFGQRLPRRLLDWVGRRAWNVHPVIPGEPLAATRGPRGFEEALRRGATEIQMCLHEMTEAFDQGDEIRRSPPVPLPRVREFTPEGFLEFQRETAPLSAALVRETLPGLLSRGPCPSPVPHRRARPLSVEQGSLA
jgi:hypothetical protein